MPKTLQNVNNRRLSAFEKLIQKLKASKFYYSTELGGLRYIAVAEFSFEVILWYFLMILFTMIAICHLYGTVSDFMSEPMSTSMQVRHATTDDYAATVHGFTYCIENRYGGNRHREQMYDVLIINKLNQDNLLNITDFVEKLHQFREMVVDKGYSMKTMLRVWQQMHIMSPEKKVDFPILHKHHLILRRYLQSWFVIETSSLDYEPDLTKPTRLLLTPVYRRLVQHEHALFNHTCVDERPFACGELMQPQTWWFHLYEAHDALYDPKSRISERMRFYKKHELSKMKKSRATETEFLHENCTVNWQATYPFTNQYFRQYPDNTYKCLLFCAAHNHTPEFLHNLELELGELAVADTLSDEHYYLHHPNASQIWKSVQLVKQFAKQVEQRLPRTEATMAFLADLFTASSLNNRETDNLPAMQLLLLDENFECYGWHPTITSSSDDHPESKLDISLSVDQFYGSEYWDQKIMLELSENIYAPKRASWWLSPILYEPVIASPPKRIAIARKESGFDITLTLKQKNQIQNTKSFQKKLTKLQQVHLSIEANCSSNVIFLSTKTNAGHDNRVCDRTDLRNFDIGWGSARKLSTYRTSFHHPERKACAYCERRTECTFGDMQVRTLSLDDNRSELYSLREGNPNILVTFTTGHIFYVVNQELKYTFVTWASGIGGILDFWLGAGLMSIIHLFLYGIKHVLRRIFRKRQHKKAMFGGLQLAADIGLQSTGLDDEARMQMLRIDTGLLKENHVDTNGHFEDE